MDKFDVKDTMLITFLGSVANTYVIKLSNISYTTYEDYTLIEIDHPVRHLKLHGGEHIFVVVSDDATMNNACDWTQLGCSKIKFSGEEIEFVEGDIIKVKVKNFKIKLVQPERRYPKNVETKFDFW